MSSTFSDPADNTDAHWQVFPKGHSARFPQELDVSFWKLVTNSCPCKLKRMKPTAWFPAGTLEGLDRHDRRAKFGIILPPLLGMVVHSVAMRAGNHNDPHLIKDNNLRRPLWSSEIQTLKLYSRFALELWWMQNLFGSLLGIAAYLLPSASYPVCDSKTTLAIPCQLSFWENHIIRPSTQPRLENRPLCTVKFWILSKMTKP